MSGAGAFLAASRRRLAIDGMKPDNECGEGVRREGVSELCGVEPIGYRLDDEDSPYLVCRKHLRPPYWLTAMEEAGR